MFDDCSKEAGYHFFNVPITEKMAENLSECKSYHRNYKYSMFYSIWNPYYKGKFEIKVNPLQNGYCRISARSSHYKVEYDVPDNLAKYVGNLMLKYCFSSEQDLTELKQYVSCIDKGIHYSEGKQYIVDVLRDIEGYISHWDATNVAKIKDFRKQKLADEELKCRENLSVMQNNMKTKNGVRKYYKNEGIFSECEFSINNNGELISYNFMPLKEHEIDDKYRLSQCWFPKQD